jgi:NAD-specific glutamate dehydrogenase
MTRQTGAPFDAALRAFLVARSLCGAESFHAAVDKAYADAAGSTKALYACLERFQEALQRVALGALRRRIAGSAGATAASYAGKLDALRGADWPPATSVPAPASEAPAEVLERLSAAEAVEAGMDLADLRDAANVPVEAARAAWLKAGEMLLVQRVLEEGARVLTPAAEDVQTRASLLEYVRDLRRRLAAAILRGPTEESLTVEGLGLPMERERAARKLEEARAREPLTVSGLFVVVEALARVVDRAVPPTGAPRTAADASHRKESAS